jgi:solute carrier family 25 2-oxodicarboxylate transporter 21
MSGKESKPYVYNPNPPPLPTWKYVVAGGSAGIIEILCMYPLDVAKTRLQLQTTGKAAEGTQQYKGLIDAFSKIVRNEGFWTLYRGIVAPIFAEAPKRAVKFASNEFYKGKLTQLGMPADERKMFLAGLGAGLTEGFVNCPFELVKVRMQQKGSVYKSTAEAARSIVANEGITGLYRGLAPQLLRNSNWDALYFMLIFTLKKRVLPPPTSKSEEMGRNFIAGLIASSIGTIFATPFDMVKSRFQGEKYGPDRKWKSVWFTINYAYKNEGGLPAVFKGLTPRLIRLGPGGGIMLVGFDYVSSLLG